MQTFKVLAALLDYPNEQVIAHLGEMRTILAGEGALPSPLLERLSAFIDSLAQGDLIDLQAAWVEQFDRTRALSLNLFEHVHGESRDRGQAMVDLRALYTERGLELETNELPDYLPVMLEFLSLLDEDEAVQLLGEAGHVIAALVERLDGRNSAYAPVMAAVARLAGESAAAGQPLSTPETDGDIDAIWAEEEINFGAGSALGGGCGGGTAAASSFRP